MTNRRPQPRGSAYPWEEWFARAAEGELVLRRGLHYDVSQASMVQIIRNAASSRRHAVHVELDTRDDPPRIVLRVLGRMDRAAAV